MPVVDAGDRRHTKSRVEEVGDAGSRGARVARGVVSTVGDLQSAHVGWVHSAAFLWRLILVLMLVLVLTLLLLLLLRTRSDEIPERVGEALEEWHGYRRRGRLAI